MFTLATTACCLFIALTYATTIFIDTNLQYWVAASISLLLITLYSLESLFGLRFRILFLTLSILVSLRYWFFRTFDTLTLGPPLDMFFMLLLYVAETYGLLIHFMGMAINVHPLRRSPVPLPEDASLWPTVDVFIPTYDESVDVVRVTAAAATLMFYPPEKRNIYILDDGGTLAKCNQPDQEKAGQARRRADDLRGMARELGVHYLTRAENLRAKAGNINAALERAARPDMERVDPELTECLLTDPEAAPGELILILDSDHVPTSDFLRNTVGFFLQDPKLFVLQTPHFFVNPSPAEKNLNLSQDAPSENDMFYGAVHLGMDFWNSSFFCGSAAVLRRSALMEAGGLAGESITEDAEVSLHLHAMGYSSAYLLKPMVCGFSPETFMDFIVQRTRWAMGMTQILALKNPLFLKGLKWSQRMCYFNSVFYWFFGLARIMYFIGPLLYLFLGLKVYMAQVGMFVVFGVPHLVATLVTTNYLFGKVRRPFLSELYEFMQSIYLLPAVLLVLRNPRKPTFKVTPKGQTLEKDFFSRMGLPFWAMAVLCLLAYPAAAARWHAYPLEHGTIILTLCWSTFNLFIVMLCLGAVWETRQVRRHHRFQASGPIELWPSGGLQAASGTLQDLSLSGVGATLSGHLDLLPGEVVRLAVNDSYDRHFSLSAEVTRVRRTAGATQVGLNFLTKDTASFLDVVAFVYGDSQRWEDITTARNSTRGGLIAGLGNMLQKSVESFTNTILGLTRSRLKRTASRLFRGPVTASGENS